MKSSAMLKLIAAAMLLLPAATQAAPRLIVAISVDQFSADLFAAYRGEFSGGLKRLQQGIVFPSAYHAHAMTETCPGHATLLTGMWPAHSGIIANNWFDQSIARADKKVYCAEDETVPGSDSKNYTVSLGHLRVPTLGDRMKAADPRSRVYAVAGKDRAAAMMGGKAADQMWWWASDHFMSHAGRPVPAIVTAVNARLAAAAASGLPAPAMPAQCAARIAPVAVRSDLEVGGAPPALPAGDAKNLRSRPELDQATIDIADALIAGDGLGKGPAPDLIAIGLSVTDYVGHRFGPGGAEMCVQMMALDAALGRLFDRLDAAGIAYAVMLSADHGGEDVPERDHMRGLPDAARVSAGTSLTALNAALGGKPAMFDDIFLSDGIFGDIHVSDRFTGSARKRLITKAKAWLIARPDVAAAFTKADLAGVAIPKRSPESWTLAERAAASFDPERSGDLVVLLKPHVTPISKPSRDAVATHGSPWDYDRRVPLLFWWPGVTGFEQPAPVATVDIMPTLAGLIGLPIDAGTIDGQCRDLDASAASTCP